MKLKKVVRLMVFRGDGFTSDHLREDEVEINVHNIIEVYPVKLTIIKRHTVFKDVKRWFRTVKIGKTERDIREVDSFHVKFIGGEVIYTLHHPITSKRKNNEN